MSDGFAEAEPPSPEVVSPSQCEIIVGQDRALRALRLGLGVEFRGYNIFVTGATGAGRTTAVKCLLEEFCRSGGRPPDICYVYNFTRPTEPVCLKLPAGTVFPSEHTVMVLQAAESGRRNVTVEHLRP